MKFHYFKNISHTDLDFLDSHRALVSNKTFENRQEWRELLFIERLLLENETNPYEINRKLSRRPPPSQVSDRLHRTISNIDKYKWSLNAMAFVRRYEGKTVDVFQQKKRKKKKKK